MIRIKTEPKIEVIAPKFLCDNTLTKHLHEYPQFSHLDIYNTTCLLGPPKSGKTSMLISILSQDGENKIYLKAFHRIYVIMPTQSRNSLKNNIFKKHDPTRLFDELTLSNLQTIYDEVQQNSLEGKSSLILYDDVGSVLKQNDIQFLLKKLTFNRRHLKCCQMFLIQSWKSTPLVIRKLYSNLIVFKPPRLDFEAIIAESIELDKDFALALMKLYKNPHDYLFINVSTQEIYLNQDRVIIEDDDNA